MAYSNYRSNKYATNRRKTPKKSKYTESEKIAFRIGLEQKVRNQIKSDKDSRIKDAFEKGLNKLPSTKDKPLFTD